VGRSGRWDQPRRTERELNNIARQSHRGIEDHKQHCRDLRAVVASVDVQDRQNDQVSEDEGHNTAEAGSSVPQYRRQGHVAHGTDERCDSDKRPELRADDLRDRRVMAVEDHSPSDEGTQAASAPATSRPSTRSVQIEAQSITK
jgi:hypothetical protein